MCQLDIPLVIYIVETHCCASYAQRYKRSRPDRFLKPVGSAMCYKTIFLYVVNPSVDAQQCVSTENRNPNKLSNYQIGTFSN